MARKFYVKLQVLDLRMLSRTWNAITNVEYGSNKLSIENTSVVYKTFNVSKFCLNLQHSRRTG